MSTEPPEAELKVLDDLFESGRPADVIDRGEPLLARFPSSFVLRHMLGTANGMLGRDDRAAMHFRQAVQTKPDFAVGYVNLGVALDRLGRGEEAAASYERALMLEPDSVEAHYCLGATLHALGRLEAAAATYQQALRIRPDHAEAHYNLGTVVQALGRSDEAMECYRRALEITPGFAEAHLNLGVLLHNQGQMDEAFACAALALAINPGLAEAHLNLGAWLQGLGCVDEAVAQYRRAIEIRPDFAEPHKNMGVVAQELGRIDQAIAWYECALELKPDFAEARALKIYQQAQICDWDAFRSDAHLLPTLGVSGDPVSPFTLLAFDDDPERQRRRAALYAAREFPSFSPSIAAQPGHDRIRIGYFSADFGEHAVMHCMARLFELHDRSRFSVHLFSYGADNQDPMRHRVRQAADAFHDVPGLSDAAVAALAREQGIDIAVDLMGYTYGSRLGIFAARAAPVQISYLGFPGTLAAAFIDYFVADKIVIPDAAREHFAEKIIFLPDSYQVNDDRRAISDRVMTRAELGLPEDGFVFCCFTNTYKISEGLFDIWMRLLGKVDGSVLWLFGANSWAENNLRKGAAKRGIDPVRLIFADHVPLPEHLARHALADLFLDTFNYSGHATASNALWAGLPLVTMAGRSLAARVAASLLSAVGLPELITVTPEEYERLALALARDPDGLGRIRARLAENRLTAPLFDSALFARNIEAAYEQAHALCAEGRPPADIVVEPGVRPPD